MKYLPALPKRPEAAHKGDFGRVLILAGSPNMPGAAMLSGTAALQVGAGLVTVGVPSSIQPIVASFSPCYMTLPLHSRSDGNISLDAVGQVMEVTSNYDVIAIGPGMGRTAVVRILLMELWRNFPKPLIVDADGLNALSDQLLFQLPPNRIAPTILTPHPGEMSRLTRIATAEIQKDREKHAKALATKLGVTVLLKGAGTIITDGTKVYSNTTGNPGMATGGSGDVLTGMIAGLAGQLDDSFNATCVACHIHGQAGDIVATTEQTVRFTAIELIGHLPSAFKVYSEM